MTARQKWILPAICAVGSVLLAGSARASVYHVAQQVGGAGDDNPGTLARPWKSLSRAVEHLKPGDTVIVHSGVYRETVLLSASGTAGAPITLRAADGEQPVISGADEVRDWTRADTRDPIYRTPWEHVFAIDWHNGQPVRTHGAEAPVGRAEQAFWWGQPLRMVMRREQLAPGTFTIDDEGKALYGWFDDDPARGGAELSTREILLGLRATDRKRPGYVVLRGLTFRHAANFAQRGAVRIEGDHWRVEDCVFEEMNGPGATITGPNHLIRRCTFRDNGQLGFGADGAHRLRLEQCRLLRNNVKGFSSGWEAGGCKIVLTRGSVIDRCMARENSGPGFWYDIGNEDSLVQNCLMARNEVGLMYEISYGLTARNNWIVNNGDPRGPAWGTGGIMVSSSPGCVLEHNLCVGNRDGIAFREQERTTPRIDAPSGAPEVPIACANETVRHNLLAYNREYQLAFWFDTRFFGPHPSGSDRNAPTGRDPATAGFTLADNLLFAASGQEVILYGAQWRPRATVPTTLASFTEASHIPATGAVADPRFVNPLAADYRLAPGSPALRLDAGLSDPAALSQGMN
jgi:Right handed beta helix region